MERLAPNRCHEYSNVFLLKRKVHWFLLPVEKVGEQVAAQKKGVSMCWRCYGLETGLFEL